MNFGKYASMSRIDLKKLLKSHLLVFIIFFFMSWVYMGNSLSNCSDTVVGQIGGDHVSGIIWLLTFTSMPYGGFSHVTNFPIGESVTQPQLITSSLNMVPAWILGKVVGPMCAWNFMVLLGYMFSALFMYAFIYWLLRHRGVALFAGLAVSFTPYHYYKSWGHLSYLHSQLFIAIFWVFLAFWRKPTKSLGVLLGFLTGLLFYSDGYFPLIGGSMLGALLLYGSAGTFLVSRKKNEALLLRFKYLVLGGVVSLVMLLPIGYTQLKYGGQINTAITNARSEVIKEMKQYGARPADFFLPSENHPIASIKNFVRNYRASNFYSNNGEYHLYLGFGSLALASYCLLVLRKKQKHETLQWQRWVVGAALSVIVFAGLLSLVPEARIGEVIIPLPSKFVGHVTSFWRVYARLYLVINIGLITIASVGLLHLSKRFKKPLHGTLLISLVIVLTLIELAPFNTLARNDQWSLSKASPTYWWLGKQKDIKAVAAYPLLENPFGTTYFGDQVIHRKPLLNSNSSVDKELLLHRSLAGLGDGQTLGVLKTLGINELLLYRVSTESAGLNLEQLFGNFGARVVRIKSSVKPLKNVLVPDSGFDQPKVDSISQVSCRKSLGPLASLTLRALDPSGPQTTNTDFVLVGQPGQKIILYSNDKILFEASFDRPGELKPAKLNVVKGQQINLFHISDSTKSFVEVCNLNVQD